jgi:riboflavin synthase
VFTGIIEEMGVISQITKTPLGAEITISCKKVLEDLKLGDSVAVNGVCLTARDVRKSAFVADVMPETLKSTNLGELSRGDYVNLERALKFDGRFGGHMISGHVDGRGRIIKTYPEGNAVVFQIGVPSELMKDMVPKGSIAVDGISLTVQAVGNQSFTVSIIPHTLASTVLRYKCPGDTVNIETDIIGKYVRTFLTESKTAYNFAAEAANKSLTAEILRSYGF